MFRFYRNLRHLFQPLTVSLGLAPHSCRFVPSCSNYCELTIRRFGIFKGSFLCVKRIMRCHPLSAPGNDPVPEK